MSRTGRWRWLRAELRDTYVLLRQFRVSLLLFVLLVGIGTLLFWQFYVNPNDGSRLSLNQSLYAAFSLVFFQTGNIPYPDDLAIDALYYLIPVLGIGIIGNSLVRFGLQLFNKELRKEEWNMSLASTYRQHVIVCGAGHVGFRVIEQLVQFNEDVVAIESNKNSLFGERVMNKLQVPLIVGDARQPDILKNAGI